MPKKTVTARGGAQRNRPKVQKSFELVRQTSEEQELEPVDSISEEPAPASVSTMAPLAEVQPVEKKETASSVSSAVTTPAAPTTTATTSTTGNTTPTSKKSAAARLAAQRQAARTQQQRAVSLITAEHYAYVRRDLIFIAILATIMFAVIIILHFVPGIGS